MQDWPSIEISLYHAKTETVDAIAGGDPAASNPTDEGE